MDLVCTWFTLISLCSAWTYCQALDNAKYDKILLVRKAASFAALEVENIPDVPVSISMDGVTSSINLRKSAKNVTDNHPQNVRSLSASAIQLPAAQERLV